MSHLTFDANASSLPKNKYAAEALRLWVFHDQSDTLAPLFQDRELTVSISNPVALNADWSLQVLPYVLDASYRLELQTLQGKAVWSTEAQRAVTFSQDVEFNSVHELLADQTLSYVAQPNALHTQAQSLIYGSEHGFAYEVAEPDSADHHLETQGGVKLYAKPMPSEYVDRQFLPAADGSSDDTAVYQKIAALLPSGKALRIAGAGTRILSDRVLFDQDDITLRFDPGAEFKQADNTEDLDQMLMFTGHRGTLLGGRLNGNLAGNTAPYTGRGELLQLTGDHWRVDGLTIDGTQDADFATGLILHGRYGQFHNITTYNTGKNAIRDRGDYNCFHGLKMFDYGEHGYVKDGGYQSQPFRYTSLSQVTAITHKSEPSEAILFDFHGVQGELARVRDVYIEAPNTTGPDCIKFAYTRRVEISGLYTSHAEVPSWGNSLRFQQEIEEVLLHNVNLAGAVNFDSTVPCNMRISGQSVFGRDMPIRGAIQDFSGTLTVEDGTEFRNLTQEAISIDASAPESRIALGRCIYHGAAGYSPNAVTHRHYVQPNTSRRLPAGLISAAPPLASLGSMRSRSNPGRWIGGSETEDAACSLNGDRVFIAGNSDFPPRDSENWQAGDVIRKRNPILSDEVVEMLCTRDGAACRAPWVASRHYDVGNWIGHNGNVYVCDIAGVSDATGGPSGTGDAIVDGEVTWRHVDILAVFKPIRAVATGT